MEKPGVKKSQKAVLSRYSARGRGGRGGQCRVFTVPARCLGDHNGEGGGREATRRCGYCWLPHRHSPCQSQRKLLARVSFASVVILQLVERYGNHYLYTRELTVDEQRCYAGQGVR